MTQILLAHVLKTDNSIGAVLHIEPEDDPIINKSSYFFFEFKDKEGKFSFSSCDCKAHVYLGGREVFSQPLNGDTSLTSSNFNFTFTQKGLYKIVAEGKPKEADSFKPFNLEYDVRVARENIPTQSPTAAFWIIPATLILLFLVFILKRKK